MSKTNLPANPAGKWLIPSTDIDQYIARVRQIPVLDAQEEQRLAYELQTENRIEAAQTLIMHHLKFVVHIARGFSGYGLPLADLIQEGNIGLMKAVKRFEPDHGVRLVSFAVHWIKSEIHEYVIRNWRMVKIATTKAQRKLFFNLRSMKKGLTWLNQDEAEKIANELNVSSKDVFEMESRLQGQDIAYEPTDDDEENPFSPSAWLSDDRMDPAEENELAESSALITSELTTALEHLDERSRDIVTSRWLGDGKKATLQTLAERYNVSAERIRQIEQQAMQTLKTQLGTSTLTQ